MFSIFTDDMEESLIIAGNLQMSPKLADSQY